MLSKLGYACWIVFTMTAVGCAGTKQGCIPQDLAHGWEMDTTCDGIPYYINHTGRKTTWSLPASAIISLSRGSERGLKRFCVRRPLPEGWRTRFTRNGHQYFFRKGDKSSTWLDPRDARNSGLLLGEPLPDGWELGLTEAGFPYFANPTESISTYEDPRDHSAFRGSQENMHAPNLWVSLKSHFNER